MKCAYVAGALKAIHDMGIKSDSIYSSSASSLTSPYFASEQIDDMLYIWRNKLTQRSASISNVLTEKAIFDIDFLVHKILTQDVPLDVSQVLKSKIKLFFSVFDINRNKGLFIKGNTNDVLERMLASSAHSVFCYPHKVKLGPKEYIDGSFYYPIPINESIAKKKNIIAVLTSQPRSKFPIYVELLEEMSPLLLKLYELEKSMKEKQEDLILQNDRILKIIPSRPLFNSYFTKDNGKLRKTINLGIRDAEHVLSNIQ